MIKYVLKFGRFYVKEFDMNFVKLDYFYNQIFSKEHTNCVYDKKLASKIKEYLIKNKDDIDARLEGTIYDEKNKPNKLSFFAGKIIVKPVNYQG